MSEQDAASVDRFPDGLDDRRDEIAGENESRRATAADAQRWEYMTWRVGHFGEKAADVRVVNGEEFSSQERPSVYEALTRAGEDGWELVGMDGASLVFKRPKEI